MANTPKKLNRASQVKSSQGRVISYIRQFLCFLIGKDILSFFFFGYFGNLTIDA